MGHTGCPPHDDPKTIPVLASPGDLAVPPAAGPYLLVVDTEGYDAEIINGIDLARYRPSLLVYEHYHLDPRDRAACRGRVEDAGYLTMEEGFDTFCVHGDAEPALVSAWRTLRPAAPGVSRHDEPPA